MEEVVAVDRGEERVLADLVHRVRRLEDRVGALEQVVVRALEDLRRLVIQVQGEQGK
jgi:hypothetical protein